MVTGEPYKMGRLRQVKLFYPSENGVCVCVGGGGGGQSFSHMEAGGGVVTLIFAVASTRDICCF